MEKKNKWKERDNDTLIDLHKQSIYNKKLYKKASNFYKFLNNLYYVIFNKSKSFL